MENEVIAVNSRRLFVGIPVTPDLCPKFFSWTENLFRESAEVGWNVRWSKPENYHITISFLGDSPNHNQDQIVEALRSESFASFWIQIQDMGFFLNGKHSNIVWAGIESKGIETFQLQVQKCMKNLGYHREIKPFRPHITLGRMKQLDEELHKQSIHTVLDQFKVSKFCLFESFFSSMRVEYKILETFSCK